MQSKIGHFYFPHPPFGWTTNVDRLNWRLTVRQTALSLRYITLADEVPLFYTYAMYRCQKSILAFGDVEPLELNWLSIIDHGRQVRVRVGGGAGVAVVRHQRRFLLGRQSSFRISGRLSEGLHNESCVVKPMCQPTLKHLKSDVTSTYFYLWFVKFICIYLWN